MNEKYAGWTSGTVAPIRPVRPAESPRAVRLVVYPCSRTILWPSSRVPGATSSRPFITRETVATDTPARPAISRIVTRERAAVSSVVVIAVIEARFQSFRNTGGQVPEHFTQRFLTYSSRA